MKTDFNYANLRSPVVWLLFLWQLPQVIAALFVLIVLHDIEPWKNEHTGMTVWRIKHPWHTCWSLGPFIFTHKDSQEDVLRHESGHSVQSLFLGPLYLFVIAIPSVILYWRRRKGNYSILWYYCHFPENWANTLGGVSIATEQKPNM